jgi:D-3-phosphoglycerate dehydrogenase
MTRILVAEPDDFSTEARAILAAAGEVELRACDRAALGAALRAYDVVWFRLAHRIDRALLEGARAKVIATPVTGLDHLDLDACAAASIQIVSLRGEVEFLKNVRATAELTVGLALGLMRRIVPAAADVRAGAWRRDRFRGHELHGKVAGIVGVGRLGRIVAGYLRGFGMDVIGADPRPDFPDEIPRVPLAELLARADVVSLHVSYDASTRHLIGEAELARMKPTAVLINTARGGVVDEAALLDALRSARIAGAALDVLDGEPDVAAHPLIEHAKTHDDLLIVPHLGGNTHESFAKTEVFLARRVVEALERVRG